MECSEKDMDVKKIPVLEIQNIYKSFNHVQALNGASMNAYRGEVLAVVGDNGAGKSTLIKILSGVLCPDGGEIKIDGETFRKLTPRRAADMGISTVYQDLALGDSMDVASNLFLGDELTKGGFLLKKRMNQEARKLIDSLDIQIPDVTEPVGNLSGGQRQGVAVARLVHRGGRILIFDEPTAAMGINESNAVLKLLRKLAQDGLSVIVISHNLPQVFHISDRICIMRQGKVIEELMVKDTSMDEVVALITGAGTEE